MGRIDPGNAAALRFEIGQLFTPSTPIKLADLFAGRGPQINQPVEAVAEPGRHAILYGERGVGKTSLSQILEYLVPSGRQTIIHSRKACTPGDTFETIWRKFFRDMRFVVNSEGGLSEATVDDLYKGTVTPDDVLVKCASSRHLTSRFSLSMSSTRSRTTGARHPFLLTRSRLCPMMAPARRW
jgi:energy-coupling factor transporter ATP-binding protein EcfA2